MLTYNDCLGLSGLTPEEVAVLARHEHLPEIVALELGWSLCGTPEGKRRIRQMILDDIEEACRRGDPRAAARLGLALHHFLDAHLGRPTGAQEAAPPSPAAEEQVVQALGLDPEAVARVRERLDSYLAAMLQRFGLDQTAQARLARKARTGWSSGLLVGPSRVTCRTWRWPCRGHGPARSRKGTRAAPRAESRSPPGARRTCSRSRLLPRAPRRS